MLETQEQQIRVQIPRSFSFLAEPHRYKSARGGRGAARSWSFSRMLLGIAAAKKIKVLCVREYQTSIKDSVHSLLKEQINQMDLLGRFIVNNDSIKSTIGGEFIFKGLHANVNEIKSIEGVDICWVEEAQSVSKESWQVLIPTIRKDGSEIWLSWNTGEEKDETYRRFVVNPPDDCISVKMTWKDNPFFPEVLDKERRWLLRVDPEAYDHIWEGNPRTISNACIFRGKYIVESFESPNDTRFYFGADWGFSDDPTVLLRSYLKDGDLWIDYESYGVGVELDEIPELWDAIPLSRNWRIDADNSRPETISHIRRKGFNVHPCLKWPSGAGKKGSVHDGIEWLRKFPVIHIHERCKHMAEEAGLYSYKIEKNGEVLPIIIDKHNHCWDALRYAYGKRIKGGTDWSAVVGD